MISWDELHFRWLFGGVRPDSSRKKERDEKTSIWMSVIQLVCCNFGRLCLLCACAFFAIFILLYCEVCSISMLSCLPFRSSPTRGAKQRVAKGKDMLSPLAVVV